MPWLCLPRGDEYEVCKEPVCLEARRERGSVFAAILDRASNEASRQTGLCPEGCSAFGLWLRCSSGHRALRLCSPPRASPQAKIAATNCVLSHRLVSRWLALSMRVADPAKE